MGKSSKLLIAVGAIASLVLVGIVLSQRNGKGPEPDAEPSVAEPTSPAAAETNRSTFFTKRVRQPAEAATDSQAMSVSETATNLVTGWEDKLDEILGSADSEGDKAKQMLEMFPRLPEDGQAEVARHLSNLLPDEDYALLQNHLTNPELPEDVLDVLLGDVLNRPNSLKLPALLEVARSEQHPKAAEAKDFLELFLEEDYGADWDKWQAGVEEWLKDNPD